jgi:hypothetical protein
VLLTHEIILVLLRQTTGKRKGVGVGHGEGSTEDLMHDTRYCFEASRNKINVPMNTDNFDQVSTTYQYVVQP